jgi:glucose uptake protein
MFIVETYTVAILFCVVTMLCWGSWANTQKLAAGHWRFELFYWDYVLGILLLALLFAFTLGSTGEGGRSFIPDVQQASGAAIGSALWGGVLFNAANILLVAAISIAGMSVAFPVGIGLALVVGVIVNYIDQPQGNALLLFGGVALVAAAILLNASAYRKLSGTTSQGESTPGVSTPGVSTPGVSTPGVSTKGLVLSVVAGLLMGFFYKYVAQSMFPDFTQPEPGKLSPYTAVVFFAVGILLSNFLFNTLLMYRPFVGEPVSYADYFRGTSRSHLTGLAGGAIWCIGMSFNIIASGEAGPAISYVLGQGATVVAALWGIYIWKEFKNAPAGTSTLLNLMLLCYLAGLGLIIAAG